MVCETPGLLAGRFFFYDGMRVDAFAKPIAIRRYRTPYALAIRGSIDP